MRNPQASDPAVSEAEPPVLARERRRIGLSSIDAAGIIYFAAPLPWAEGLFTEWLAGCGRPMSALLADGIAFPVVDARTSYRAPLRLDDVVELELAAIAVATRSFTMRTRIAPVAGGPVAVEVRIAHVFVSDIGGELRAAAVPDWLRALLTGPGDGA